MKNVCINIVNINVIFAIFLVKKMKPKQEFISSTKYFPMFYIFLHIKLIYVHFNHLHENTNLEKKPQFFFFSSFITYYDFRSFRLPIRINQFISSIHPLLLLSSPRSPNFASNSSKVSPVSKFRASRASPERKQREITIERGRGRAVFSEINLLRPCRERGCPGERQQLAAFYAGYCTREYTLCTYYARRNANFIAVMRNAATFLTTLRAYRER